MPRSRSITAPLAIAALLLLAPTLTGCMQNPIEKLVEEGISEAVEGVTGVDVDVSGGKLPDNFPSSVALVDGEVRDAGAITVSGETTFNVTLVTSGTVEEAYADGRARLASAGYEEVVAQQMNDNAMAIMNGEYSVIFNVNVDSGTTIVTYVVGPPSE